jgi:hypothetical protein
MINIFLFNFCYTFKNNVNWFPKKKKNFYGEFITKKNLNYKMSLNSKEIQKKKTKEKFLSWLFFNNVYIFNKSTWGRAPHQCFISNETTDEGEPCGKGLIAYKNIQQGEKLIEIPEKLIIKNDDDFFLKENLFNLNEYDALAILIMREQSMGEKSKWQIYFEMLPNQFDLNLAFRWKKSDVIFLKGSKILRASFYLKEKIKMQYLRIENEVFSKNLLKYPKKIFNIQTWEWALSLLLSRAIFLQNIKKISLVPYADFINHNPFSSSFINSKQVAFSNANEITLYSDKDYNKLDQVFVTYGQKSNLELLILYGFILERNPYDSVDLRISISPNDNLYLKKKKFLQECNKPLQITFPMFYYKYPRELYEFLRFCLFTNDDCNFEDFFEFDFNNSENKKLEKLIRKTVIFSCEKNLKIYCEKINEEKILEVLNNFFLITRNQKIALKQRRCEKKILQRLKLNLLNEF